VQGALGGAGERYVLQLFLVASAYTRARRRDRVRDDRAGAECPDERQRGDMGTVAGT